MGKSIHRTTTIIITETWTIVWHDEGTAALESGRLEISQLLKEQNNEGQPTESLAAQPPHTHLAHLGRHDRAADHSQPDGLPISPTRGKRAKRAAKGANRR